MAPNALNHNDAGKAQRLGLINSVLEEVFGSTVRCDGEDFVVGVEADDC